MSADRDSLVEKVAKAIFAVDYGNGWEQFWEQSWERDYRRARYLDMADAAVTVVARDIARRMSIALAAEVNMEIEREEEEL